MGCCESKANVETIQEFAILSGRNVEEANGPDGLNQPTQNLDSLRIEVDEDLMGTPRAEEYEIEQT